MGLDHFLMGSVSEAEARHARCSVEIVRNHSAGQLAGKVGFGLAFPYFTVHGFLQALSVL